MLCTSLCSMAGRLMRRMSPCTRIMGGRPEDRCRSEALFLTTKARSSEISTIIPFNSRSFICLGPCFGFRPALTLKGILVDISELLAFVVKNKASDLHLSSGLPPMIRVHGDIRRINLPAMEHKDVHSMIYDIMNDGQRKHYEENLECDFSFAIPGLARFRVNAFVQNRGAAAVMRTIPSKILSLEELRTPKIFTEIVDQPRGIVLVTGPTGSGKSTTLAAMVNQINDNEQGHILTIEDPIEFVHESKKCLINQREVGPHTLSFANAL